MLASPYRAELEERLGKLWFDNAELLLKGFDDKIIGEMQRENALCSEYKKLLASARIDFDGKTLNLPQLRAYQLSPDREVRKAAYAKRTEFFMQNAQRLDEIFDQLVKLRTEMARKLGYENFVELGYIRMKRNSYNAQDVEKFRNQVKEQLVPFLQELHEQRRLSLGVGKLMFYDEDMYFKDGNPAPQGTPAEIFENGRRMYSELSAETREFINFMLENELFDALAKEGKSGGGYCTEFPGYKAPFVFANFNGTSEDVDVLTHECGHALNSYLTRDMEILEYRDPTFDVAEIHSMSMEFFTANWMDLFFRENTRKYLLLHLSSALIFLPYGCMVDEFQHIIYSQPELTPDERKAVWKRLEGEYKPYLDYGDDPFFGRGGRWQGQSHIYERPFYYIDYCIAQICALQYRIWMEKDGARAWDSYISLSKKAGSKRLTELIEEAGLMSPFEDDCIKAVANGAGRILKKLGRK
jgi:M3 family oligoendopeptidase